MIEIFGLPAHIKQAVDRAAAPKDPPPRPGDIPAIQARITFRAIAPIGFRVVHRFEITNRDVDPWIGVAPTRFEQSHRVFCICRQPICQRTAGGSRSNYYKVKLQAQLHSLKNETFVLVFIEIYVTMQER